MNMNVLGKKFKVRNLDVKFAFDDSLIFPKGRNASRTSASLPSMTVIGSAQPDVLRIKVYVTIRFGFFRSISSFLLETE